MGSRSDKPHRFLHGKEGGESQGGKRQQTGLGNVGLHRCWTVHAVQLPCATDIEYLEEQHFMMNIAI